MDYNRAECRISRLLCLKSPQTTSGVHFTTKLLWFPLQEARVRVGFLVSRLLASRLTTDFWVRGCCRLPLPAVEMHSVLEALTNAVQRAKLGKLTAFIRFSKTLRRFSCGSSPCARCREPGPPTLQSSKPGTNSASASAPCHALLLPVRIGCGRSCPGSMLGNGSLLPVCRASTAVCLSWPCSLAA